MIVKTQENITLLKIEQKDFTGKDGKQIQYVEATILDNDGNKFHCAIDKDSGIEISTSRREVKAEFVLFINSFNSKAVLKMRLLSIIE